MKKYPKEFILLLSDWLRGSITDKNLFLKYNNIIEQELIKNKSCYRIWDFENKDINNIIKNGILNIEKSYFESSFFNENDEHLSNFEFVEKIISKLTPYISDFKLITKRSGDVFNPYYPLEYCLQKPKLLENFTLEEQNIINKRLERYKYQKEFLLINPEEKIRFREIEYIMVSEYVIKNLYENNLEKMKDNDKYISTYMNYKIKNYFCYDINNFLLLTKKIPILNNGIKNFCYPELEL